MWRDVPGWEGHYQVSSQGLVRSCDRVIHFASRRGGFVSRPCKGRLLAPAIKERGYRQVTLTDPNRERISAFVHELVLLAFVGPRPEGAVCRHLDDDRANNTLANLAYGTPQENTADALRNGRHPRGERSGVSKLTETQVREARARALVEPIKAIATDFGVEGTTIRALVDRKTWAHVV